jgi:predicted dehydrogenase
VLRGAIIGCGFFARNHIHAWRELEGVEMVAACDLDARRARQFAGSHGIPATYTDPARMLAEQRVDFVDIVTQPHTHRELVEAAAGAGVHVICQKPLAPSLKDARAMVEVCRAAGVRFMVHENFRWQTPMRALREAAREIGPLFHAQISFRSGWDVYAAQPYLATDKRFILYDLGVHLLDLARFFAGEAVRLHCEAQRVNPRIRGEDAATVLLRMDGGAVCVVEMSYATRPERELFPQTLVRLEGADGTAELGPDYQLAVTTARGTERQSVAPDRYAWSAPPAEAIQQSVVAIQRHWLECLREGREPETSGADNLRTLELVFGAYRSAERGEPYLPAAVPRSG